ncbi:unnamed protein product [Rotaria sp. Silwood1]|nr:unnamed protein product [Rotaria sp. Silwood1]
MICEYGVPLNLSNEHDFCGKKVVKTTWQIDNNVIDFPVPFSSAIRSNIFEQLHLNSYFDLHLHKLMIFGSCPHTKIYNFDDTIFISYATIIVFLPSNYIGGNYRFIDQNLEPIYTSIFNQHELNNSKAFIIVVPTDCEHEIEPIEKGFKVLLVYHLVAKSKSIHELYSLIWKTNSYSTNLKTIFETQRIQQIFSFWEKNLNKMPTKLIIPLQHSLDDSSYFSHLFRDKYRIIFELIISALKYFSTFLMYSATFQIKSSSDSKFFIRNMKLLNSTNKITIDLNSEHQRTVLINEFFGELDAYIDAVEESIAIRQFFHSKGFHEKQTKASYYERLSNISVQPLEFDHSYQIRIKNLPNTLFTFPLSNTLCSRMICEYEVPLNLTNEYDFCGKKVVNTAWQIDNNVIDFSVPFSSAIRSNIFEQLHLNSYFDLHLHKLMIFGPCPHTKIYIFDDTIFISYATIIVFLPSNYIDGNYRFIDQNLESIYTSIFNQHELNNSKAFIIVVPTVCEYEIEPIEKGFKVLLVYHLVAKSKSIHELYCLIWKTNSYSTNLET